MQSKAKRTLVKSAPELWELAEDDTRMELWLASLVGATGSLDVVVTDREPGRLLAWQTAGGGPFGRIVVELAEKGFGTSVAITAHSECRSAVTTGRLENLLDELGSPERQPFVRS